MNPSPGVASTEVTESVLDRETLRALCSDIGQLTVVQEVLVKQRGERRVQPPGGWSLSEAFELLETHQVAGIQVRYHHDHRDWCDTLMVSPGGFRIVRIPSPTEPEPPAS